MPLARGAQRVEVQELRGRVAHLLRGLALRFLLGALGALGKPLEHPIGRVALGDGGRVAGREEQQAQGMFAGELAAGAGTLGGEIGEGDPHLVERGALTLAPQRRGVLAEPPPGGGRGELLGRGGRARIGSEGGHLFDREVHGGGRLV